MNQPIAMEMFHRTAASRKRKNTEFAPTVVASSDPANCVATRMMRTTSITNTFGTAAHQSTFQDNDKFLLLLLLNERIVATSLKRGRKEVPISSCRGTQRTTPFTQSQRLQPESIESDHLLTLPSKMTSDRTKVESLPLLSHIMKLQLHHPTNEPSIPHSRVRKVRFASWTTVTTIPSTVDMKTTCWYERKDYESFELDCRQSILAFMSLHNKSVKATTSSPTKTTASVPQQQVFLEQPFGGIQSMKTDAENTPQPLNPEPGDATRTTFYFTIHGLDDFTSVEAKILRTRRRFEHCYNVLYHQWILQQLQQQRRNCSIQIGIDSSRHDSTYCADGSPTATMSSDQALLLQQIAQLSSFESMRLALVRGQSNIATKVH